MTLKKSGILWLIAYGWRVKSGIGKHRIPDHTDLCRFARHVLAGLFMWPLLHVLFVGLFTFAWIISLWFGMRPDASDEQVLFKPYPLPTICGFRILPIYSVLAWGIVWWLVVSFGFANDLMSSPPAGELSEVQCFQLFTVFITTTCVVAAICYGLYRCLRPFVVLGPKIAWLPRVPFNPEWLKVLKAYTRSFKERTCMLINFE